MPQSYNRYCLSTPVTPLLPLHKQTNTGNCTALTTQNIMPQSQNRYCTSTPVTPLLPLYKQTNTGNCTDLTTKNIMPQSHNRYCLLPKSHQYCRYISRQIPVTAPPSLHKTLCTSLTMVTALLPPSHHYCSYICRPIPVTAPPHYTKHYAPVSQPLLPFYTRHTITAAT